MNGPWRIRLRDRIVETRPGRPLVMGIVNAGPDSFSDATRLRGLEAQVARGVELAQQGAQIVDVGGESGVTYTGATAAEDEVRRVAPLVERLVAEGITVSVDTWKAPVARAALEAGAAMLNDVSGLRDPELARLAAASGAALVVMHTRAAPKEEHVPDYGGDVAGDVVRFLAERCALAVREGVGAQQLVVDPGPDFAKSPHDSVEVLRAIERLTVLRRPWLAAMSRKYFVGAITGRPPAQRLAGTLAAVGFAVDAGAAIVRVHDVAETVDFLAVRGVLRAEIPMPEFDAGDDGLKWIRADV